MIRKSFNDYVTDGIFVYIKVKESTIIIDSNDLELVGRYRWYIDSKGYPATRIWYKETKTSKLFRLHNFLMGKKEGLVIDHINGNKIDNTRLNLRFCTISENCTNKIDRKGYTLLKNKNISKPYVVRWQFLGKEKAKKFSTEKEAIIFKVTNMEKTHGFCRYRQMYQHYFQDNI